MKNIGLKSIDFAKTLLGISSLLVYFLTGKVAIEFTFATTIQLYDPYLKDWNPQIIERFSIPKILPKIFNQATVADEINIFGKRMRE
jgi:sugar (pentulose or hexulose) kinase